MKCVFDNKDITNLLLTSPSNLLRIYFYIVTAAIASKTIYSFSYRLFYKNPVYEQPKFNRKTYNQL